jgi:GNAT superfamily N-acetyltransferase
MMSADSEVTVRRAGPNDLDDLYPLARELATSFEPSRTTFAASFSDLISDPNVLVLVATEEQSGQLIGYLLGFRHETFFAGGPVGWVDEVHTRADRRRAGVARALMLEFEHWAWEGGARLVALATRRARAFYAAIGYEDSALYLRKLAPE